MSARDQAIAAVHALEAKSVDPSPEEYADAVLAVALVGDTHDEPDLADDLALDYIRAYYALVTAARGLLDAMTRFGPDDSGQLWDAAQAVRALVGDEATRDEATT